MYKNKKAEIAGIVITVIYVILILRTGKKQKSIK